MKNALMRLTMLLGFTMVATACGADTPAEQDANENESEEVSGDAAEELTYSHQLGETTVEKQPEKVVVFDMGVLDSLDKLGVEVSAVPKDSVPDYLDKYRGDDYENAGTLFEPDFEKIYDLDPDLIIISGRASDAYEELDEIAPTLFMGIDNTDYVGSFKENVTRLGEIFDKEEQATQELAAIDDAIAELHEKATSEAATGLIVMLSEGDLSAYGPGSRFGFLHDQLGIEAIDQELDPEASHGQNVSYEYVVEQNPDYLFVIDRAAAIGDEPADNNEFENELIQNTQAYKDGNIVYLDPVYWYISSGGLTSVAGMVDEVAAGLE